MIPPTNSFIELAFAILVFFLSGSIIVESNDSLSTTSKHDYLFKFILKLKDRAIDTDDRIIENNDLIEYDPTFVQLYYAGVEAYLSNDWITCIDHFERSLHLYHQYIETVANCRVQCEFERNRFKNTRKENFDYIHFYEKLIVKTLCLEKCRQKMLSNLPRYFVFEKEHREVFKMRKPYEYLQLCYYKEKNIEKAISSTYTALVVNPDDEVMKKNIQYYAKLDEYDLNKIKDLEDKRYSSYYQKGVDKYALNEWTEAIELIEIALDIWLQEHDKCRALCDSEFDQGWLTDFTTSVSNHYVYTLRCKQNCTRELSYINGLYYDDLYPGMYNYLQFAYYHSHKLEEASRCAASYILFNPNDEEMIGNVEFYENKRKNSKKYLQPREEAEAFYYRTVFEVKLLNFVDEEFSKLAKEPFRKKFENNDLSDIQIENERIDNMNVINKDVE